VSEHEPPDAEPDNAPVEEDAVQPPTGPDEWDDPAIGVQLDDDGSGTLDDA
jgi:hypothetical protein